MDLHSAISETNNTVATVLENTETITAEEYSLKPTVIDNTLAFAFHMVVPRLDDTSEDTVKRLSEYFNSYRHNVNYEGLNPTVYMSGAVSISDDGTPSAQLYIPFRKIPQGITATDLAESIRNSVAVSTVNNAHRFI